MSITMPIIDGSKIFEYIESVHQMIKDHIDVLNKQLGIFNDPKSEENGSDYPEGMLKFTIVQRGAIASATICF